MRKKRLPWNLHYLGHAPMPTIIHSPFSFAQTMSPCVKPSYHHILECSSSSVFIQWIPGHSSIPGNDLATKQQKKPPSLPISLSSPIQIINKTVRDAPPTHDRVAAFYKLRSFHRDVKQITNRRDEVLIACLRSGHHPSLKQYLHRLDPSQHPICPNCQKEQQDLAHWLRNCPALSSMRQRVFGCHQGSLE